MRIRHRSRAVRLGIWIRSRGIRRISLQRRRLPRSCGRRTRLRRLSTSTKDRLCPRRSIFLVGSRRSRITLRTERGRRRIPRIGDVRKQDPGGTRFKETLIPLSDHGGYAQFALLICLLRPIFAIPLNLCSQLPRQMPRCRREPQKRREQISQEHIPVLLDDLFVPRIPAPRPTREVLRLTSREDGHMVMQDLSAIVQYRGRSLGKVCDSRFKVGRRKARR